MGFVAGLGNPLIIASDIAPAPRLLEKVAASLPTRVISPKISLTKKEKNQMVKSYAERMNSHKLWKNTHEKDALASALFAWGQLRSLIERIKKKLDTNDVLEDEIRDYVMSSVLLNNSSISSSINNYPNQFFKYKIARIK